MKISYRSLSNGTIGFIITAFVIACLEISSQSARSFSNSGPVLLMTIVSCAFIAGLSGGLVSALLAWITVAWQLSAEHHLFPFSEGLVERELIWILVAPAMALMVGELKRRAEKSLKREVEERRRSEESVRVSEIHSREVIEAAYQSQSVQLSVTRILTDSKSMEDAIPEIISSMAQKMDWSIGEFWILDPESQSLRCSSFWHNSAPGLDDLARASFSSSQSFGSELANQVLQSDQPCWVSDVFQEFRFASSFKVTKAHIHSAVGFPIRVDKKLVGVMNFFSSKVEEPSEVLVSMMADIGGRIGNFLQRMKAEDELAELLRQLDARAKERTAELAVANEKLKTEIIEKENLFLKAETANRLKDEFLATVSHELRTPLNVIQGHSELLLCSYLDSEVRQSVEAIFRNVKSQHNLINDLLDVSRIITGKMQINTASEAQKCYSENHRICSTGHFGEKFESDHGN